jgi:hypothetical protein
MSRTGGMLVSTCVEHDPQPTGSVTAAGPRTNIFLDSLLALAKHVAVAHSNSYHSLPLVLRRIGEWLSS